MTIGQKIKTLRKNKKITLTDLSNKSGLSISTLSDIENGKSSPKASTLNKIANGLNVQLLEIIEHESNNLIINNSDNESDIKFTDPVKAMEFIISQPTVGDYGNFDINKLTDEDKINFANDLLEMIKMISPKYTK